MRPACTNAVRHRLPLRPPVTLYLRFLYEASLFLGGAAPVDESSMAALTPHPTSRESP